MIKFRTFNSIYLVESNKPESILRVTKLEHIDQSEDKSVGSDIRYAYNKVGQVRLCDGHSDIKVGMPVQFWGQGAHWICSTVQEILTPNKGGSK